jgi:hypothetical protein
MTLVVNHHIIHHCYRSRLSSGPDTRVWYTDLHHVTYPEHSPFSRSRQTSMDPSNLSCVCSGYDEPETSGARSSSCNNVPEPRIVVLAVIRIRVVCGLRNKPLTKAI